MTWAFQSGSDLEGKNLEKVDGDEAQDEVGSGSPGLENEDNNIGIESGESENKKVTN